VIVGKNLIVGVASGIGEAVGGTGVDVIVETGGVKGVQAVRSTRSMSSVASHIIRRIAALIA
jgi:hypothetical protein